VPPSFGSARPGAHPAGRGRTQRPAGPLVARRDLAEQRAARALVRRNPSRVRRFVDRYGWRAYAIPFLTVATLAVLVDLAVRTPAVVPAAAAGVTTAPPVPASRPAVPTPPAPATDVDAAPTAQASPVGPQPFVEKGAGTVSVVDGSSRVYGRGPLRRFVVEVEDGAEVDGAGFARAVERTLADPRSWGHGGGCPSSGWAPPRPRPASTSSG
jgi:Protein of unknown function (DUF3152)